MITLIFACFVEQVVAAQSRSGKKPHRKFQKVSKKAPEEELLASKVTDICLQLIKNELDQIFSSRKSFIRITNKRKNCFENYLLGEKHIARTC